jgi:TolB-like protein/Tfp pilus assembly protein PilF
MVEGGGEDKANVRAPALFISYASQDAAAAARICSALRQAGIEVWFDQSELRGGDVWDQRIRREIRDCTLFMPVISANTASRHEGYFRLEWDLADQRTHMMARDRAFIVPVCLDATAEAGTDVPESFHRVQWTRLLDGNTPSAFTARIVALLGAPGAVASAAKSTHTAAKTGHGAPPALTLAATSKSTLRKNRLAIALMATIAGILAYVAVDRLWLSKHTPAEKPATAVAPAPTPATPAIPEKSVAVLPFVDMSEKKDQEYFSDGLSEELIDLLTKVPDLRVPARTSSFFFKGKAEDIATIAKKLRVAHVLEGSVRKAGNTMRVTAQLIRADNGYHLWSETYDRELKDVFKVQDEIAGAVVTALKLKLAPGQRVPTSHRTSVFEAYDHYLLGRQFYERGNPDGYRRAIEAYHKAIELDPRYAAAYVELAVSEYFAADEIGETAGKERALAAAEKAIEVAPSEAIGYSTRGYLRDRVNWDWTGAQADMEKALAIDSADAETQAAYALVLDNVGRLPQAIAAAQKATDLEPLSSEAWRRLGTLLIRNRHFAAAQQALRRALEIEPESTQVLFVLAELQLLEGNAIEALAAFREVDNEGFRLWGIAMAEHTLDHAAESQQALNELIAKHTHGYSFEIAQVYAWRSEKDKAFEWLERSYQQREGDLVYIKDDELLAPMRGDPRYKALLRKMNLPE